MKNIRSSNNSSFLKKIFIKLCRKLGFEIIDQNTFEVVTVDKKINDDLSLIGKSSINLPLGKVNITRPVEALDIIIRTCASVNMLTQNKSRLFEKEKIEYTLRTIRSLLNSVKINPQLEKIKINFKVIDHNSSQENLEKIDTIFKNFGTNYNLINLDVSKFENEIEKINERGQEVSSNQISNMANINQSLIEAKKCEDGFHLYSSVLIFGFCSFISHTTRKPARYSGLKCNPPEMCRVAERTSCALLLNPPPRQTCKRPFSGPFGSAVTFFIRVVG